MFSGDRKLGYTNASDDEAIRTIHAALDAGITVFDTAPAYGAGHGERLLGQALKGRTDALVVTKFGVGIDEDTKELSFDAPTRASVQAEIDASLARLERDQIDLLLFHQNEFPIEAAGPLFDEVERAYRAGKVRAFGWSTDFSDRVDAMANREGFVAIEHAMNVFFGAPQIQKTAVAQSLTTLIRSPLAMGVLTGKYDEGRKVPDDDIRASTQPWMDYFKNGTINPDYQVQLDAVRELLITGGRSLVQGALGWLWAKGPSNLPVPGARTVEQVQGIAQALEFGALSEDVMTEIDKLIDRRHETLPERQR
jgi:aryl-alcohol dehydrogenase-like predicted oxidoreductase